MTEEIQPKKKKASAPKQPATVDALVAKALHAAATKPKAKWSGASGAVLFSTKDANHQAAEKACTTGDSPLLKWDGKTWALTAAGFAKVASELPTPELVALATEVSSRMSGEDRVGLLSGVIGRNQATAAELTPLLEQATKAAKEEQDARVAAVAKQAAEREANAAAMEKALALINRAKQDQKDAIRRMWEALGEDSAELPEPSPKPLKREESTTPEPKTDEEKDFRRASADQFADVWRTAWDQNKSEAVEYLGRALWNIPGLRREGEVGAKVTFNGRYHVCTGSAFPGDPVRVTRPGWVLKGADQSDVVVLEAVVDPI